MINKYRKSYKEHGHCVSKSGKLHAALYHKALACNIQKHRPEVFLRKGGLEICSKFTREHPCWSMISIKLISLPVNLLHIFRTPFVKNISERLLLNIGKYFTYCYVLMLFHSPRKTHEISCKIWGTPVKFSKF